MRLAPRHWDLRRLTFIEVGLDLLADGLGMAAFELLRSLSRAGVGFDHDPLSCLVKRALEEN